MPLVSVYLPGPVWAAIVRQAWRRPGLGALAGTLGRRLDRLGGTRSSLQLFGSWNILIGAGCPAGPLPTGAAAFTYLFRGCFRPGLANERVGSMNALTFERVGFAVAVLFSGVAGDAWGQVQYTVTDLGTLSGGTHSVASAINNSGQVVGDAFMSNGDDHAFLYSNGVMQDLGTLPSGNNSEANAINNHGEIVGRSDSGASLVAFSYSGNGPMENLGVAGPGACATGVNDSGQVVGYHVVSGYYCGFLYSGGSVESLGLGLGSFGSGINNSGQVVGYGQGSGGFHAFLFSGGTTQDLGPGGATAINNSGEVVGTNGWYAGKGDMFLYSNGVMQDLGTLPSGTWSNAYAINDLGQIVGDGDDSGRAETAILYSDGIMQDLNALIPSNSGWVLERGTGINDSGQICGYGINPGGQTDAFLLTPIPTPEPSTLALLGAGALALATYAWRRRRTLSE